MTEQKSKALTPAQAIGRQPVAWAIGLVESFGKKYPGLLQTATAQRCAMSAVSKVVNFMTEQGFGWDQVDTSHLSRIFIRLAIFGLDAESGDWYAYSRKNSKTGLQQFDPNPSYQGERMLRIKYSIGSYGKIQDIQALTIREGDKLAIKKDLFGKVSDVQYEPISFNKGKTLGYLGIVLFEDGTTLVKEYSPEKIEEYHKANPNKSPAWDKWYEEMAHAKVIKHTSKDFKYDLPEKIRAALDEVQVTDIDETAESQEASKAIDITPDEPEPLPEQEQPKKEPEPETAEDREQMEIDMPDCLKG